MLKLFNIGLKRFVFIGNLLQKQFLKILPKRHGKIQILSLYFSHLYSFSQDEWVYQEYPANSILNLSSDKVICSGCYNSKYNIIIHYNSHCLENFIPNTILAYIAFFILSFHIFSINNIFKCNR